MKGKTVRSIWFPLVASLCAFFIMQGKTNASEGMEPQLIEARDYILKNPWPAPSDNIGFAQHYALLLLHAERDIGEANRLVLKFCKENPGSARSETLLRTYLLKDTRELLTDEARRAIEDYAWHLLENPDSRIGRLGMDYAKNSYFDHVGSENHFVNDRRHRMLALQIVHLAERYGPDAGLGDGETVAAHYRAWIDFWKRYFRERAVSGSIDMEVAHLSSYGQCTVSVYYDLYDLVDSNELHRLAGDYLNLYWAEVAVEFEPRTGQRSGWSAARNSHYVGEREYWSRLLHFIYGWHELPIKKTFLGEATFLTSGYRPPAIITAIAGDPERGIYQAVSRRAALMEDVWRKNVERYHTGEPRGVWNPLEDDSYLRRDVYYTPDFALSTISFDPSRVYDPHITLAQTMGATVSSDQRERITILGCGHYAERAINGITGEGVSVIARDINAAIGESRFESAGTRVFFRGDGELWANRIEDGSGWFFTRSGDAYAALKVAGGGYKVTDQTYRWERGRPTFLVDSRHGYYLELENKWAPVVLQMGRAADYESFEDFMESVKQNRFEYVESYYEYGDGHSEAGIMTYVSEAGDTYTYYSRSIRLPRINGEEVNLNPEKNLDSPFLSMVHGETTATMSYPGYEDVVLDFAIRE